MFRQRGESWRASGLEGQLIKAIAVSLRARAWCMPDQARRSLRFKRWRYYVEPHRGLSEIRGKWFWLSPAEPPFSAYVQSIALSPTDPE